MPFGDTKVLPECFDIRDEVPGTIFSGLCVGTRVAAAALVKKNDAVMLRVEELGIGFGDVSAWTAMEIDDLVVLARLNQMKMRLTYLA